MPPLLDISDLRVTFRQPDAVVQAVRGASFHVDPGESLGIVGESGSGKSVTCLAALRLLREPPATVAADRLLLDGTDMLRADKRTLAAMRGSRAAMVFQDPMTAFDPSFTIGDQIIETILAHRPLNKRAARAEAESLLSLVEIRDPPSVCDSYAHQLSGGMLQRSMIAMALSCRPKLLFADEPTTALDVTVQAQILQLIKGLQAEFAMALVMVTHDLGVIAETTDRVVVMYGGQVMETAAVADLFDTPRHPYTAALLASIPGQQPGKRRLTEIPGAAPNPAAPPPGCPFHARCPQADARCAAEQPPMVSGAACWRLA
jgi:oligopeptide/dipeptide ABC transporter ATP-binding protein